MVIMMLIVVMDGDNGDNDDGDGGDDITYLIDSGETVWVGPDGGLHAGHGLCPL